MDEKSLNRSWWLTMPGVLTGIGALMITITGLLVAFFHNGVFGGGELNSVEPSKQEPLVFHSEPRSNDREKESGKNVPTTLAQKPWSLAEALITKRNGMIINILAESFSSCIGPSNALTLTSGRQIPFENMDSFEVLQSDLRETPNAKAIVRIRLLDGATVTDQTGADCDLFGYNQLGRLTTNFQEIKRVEFMR